MTSNRVLALAAFLAVALTGCERKPARPRLPAPLPAESYDVSGPWSFSGGEALSATDDRGNRLAVGCVGDSIVTLRWTQPADPAVQSRAHQFHFADLQAPMTVIFATPETLAPETGRTHFSLAGKEAQDIAYRMRQGGEVRLTHSHHEGRYDLEGSAAAMAELPCAGRIQSRAALRAEARRAEARRAAEMAEAQLERCRRLYRQRDLAYEIHLVERTYDSSVARDLAFRRYREAGCDR